MPVPRVNILGVGVSATYPQEALKLVQQEAKEKRGARVCLATVNGIMEAQNEVGLRLAFNESFLTFPDGMPSVWLSRAAGYKQTRRCYGPDFMKLLCLASAKTGGTHFLYGGNEGVAEDLKAKLESTYPGIQIVGTHTPPFRPLSPEETHDLRQRFAELKPDYVWVGISSPKQEAFMASMQGSDVGVFFGVGAAFDFLTGRQKEAPQWMQKSGLQWLHRLCSEPKRLWYRYLVLNPLFVIKVLLQFLGMKHYDLDSNSN